MWDSGQKCEPTFGKLLSLEQRQELKDLLEVHYSTLTGGGDDPSASGW